jgi:hypothetical protein
VQTGHFDERLFCRARTLPRAVFPISSFHLAWVGFEFRPAYFASFYHGSKYNILCGAGVV